MEAPSIDWGYALLITIMGIMTVFFMLLILIGIINVQKKLINRDTATPVVASAPTSAPQVNSAVAEEMRKEAESVGAAIAMAVHLHLKAKNSNMFITIKRISNSPWSAKENSMTNKGIF